MSIGTTAALVRQVSSSSKLELLRFNTLRSGYVYMSCGCSFSELKHVKPLFKLLRRLLSEVLVCLYVFWLLSLRTQKKSFTCVLLEP